jgi:isopenicillin N synthase-like dioxygenase
MSDFSNIPLIDLAPLRTGGGAARRQCAQAIGRACREVGFFYIVNHGVAPGLVAEVYDVAARFFALTPAEKMDVAMSKSPLYRGYFPLGGEVTDPALGGDPKEGFDISLELGAADPDVRAGKPLRGPNQWPPRPPELRPVLSRYFDAMCGLGRTLSAGFALALDLPEDFFADKLDRPTAILRILHYPGSGVMVMPNAPDFGCGAHSDYGYLTILAQDDTGGLQVQNSAGRWIEAPPIPASFVCNIGEMMERWSNDVFRATKHRVIRRQPGSRYSVPFFFHPNPEVDISCLESCLAAGGARYQPTTALDYLMGRLVDGYG